MYIEFLVISFLLFRIKNNYIISLITLIPAFYCTKYSIYEIHEKFHHVSGLIRYWPTFALAVNVCLYNLFDKLDNALSLYLKRKVFRIVVYISLILLIHFYYPKDLVFLQFYFCYIIVALTNAESLVGNFLCFLGKHSLNIWLIHTFICYYYWQSLFLKLLDGNAILSVIILLVISLLMSIAINYFYNILSNLKKVNA